MPTYTDPIILETMLVNRDRFFYLVKISNEKYKFCALSLRDLEGNFYNLDRLQFDPSTRLERCWPIAWKKVANADQSILFPQDVMRDEPFTRLEVIRLFAVDPMTQIPETFNVAAREAARKQYAQTIGIVDSNMLDFICTNECINAIQKGIFTLQDLVTMSFVMACCLSKPASIIAINTHLFTTQELISLGYTKADCLTRPSCLRAILDGVYTKEALIAIDSKAHLEWVTGPSCVKLIQRGIFTLQELLNIESYKVACVTKPKITEGILNGVFTKQSVLNMDNDKLNYLSMMDRVDILHTAIRDGHTTLEHIEQMDLDTLKQAISSGHFPAPGMSLN